MGRIIVALPDGIWGIVALFAIIAVSLVILSKAADMLVDEAVSLSVRWGVPKMIIGATIVSLGTTLPEVTVSVVSALNGIPDLAMGNAVGSIICDTGMILGIAALIKPLPFEKKVINRQSWMQFAAGLLLVLTAFLAGRNGNIFTDGGQIPQFVGWIYLGLLALYIWFSIRQARKDRHVKNSEDTAGESAGPVASTWQIMVKLLLGMFLVIISSKVLIPAVQEVAIRLHVPQTVIAATLVAFGTSLPELVTAIASTRRGHGDLAIGNIMGADILNVLFVVGCAASVTKGGLLVDARFFRLLFPVMLFVLIIFKGSVLLSKKTLKRPVGMVLLVAYIAGTIASYFMG
jgi:cation:H+ antiporter